MHKLLEKIMTVTVTQKGGMLSQAAELLLHNLNEPGVSSSSCWLPSPQTHQSWEGGRGGGADDSHAIIVTPLTRRPQERRTLFLSNDLGW